MSTGNIIGAVVGGIAGFFMGGPLGAIYGAGMGFSLGGMVDPNTPDSPTPGAPDPSDLIVSSTVGDPVADLCGTGKITGHLLAYGKERVVEHTETQETGGKGGGGSVTQVTGYSYYMTWVLGICIGPVCELYSIYKGEDIVWEGVLHLEDAVNGEETITLDGVGSCTFYFGTSDQTPDSVFESIISDANFNSAYRNFCYVVFDDCKIGETSARLPTYSFVLRKGTDVESYKLLSRIQKFDANPVHCCIYILTKLCGLPIYWLDLDSFTSAAITLYEEDRGVSILFTSQQTAISYLSSILTHSNAILFFNSNGKFSFTLNRNDYDLDTLPSINEGSILGDVEFTRNSWVMTKNEVKVQYTELLGDREDVYIPLHTSRPYPIIATDLESLSINLVRGILTSPTIRMELEELDVDFDVVSGIFNEKVIYTDYTYYELEEIDLDFDVVSGIFDEVV